MRRTRAGRTGSLPTVPGCWPGGSWPQEFGIQSANCELSLSFQKAGHGLPFLPAVVESVAVEIRKTPGAAGLSRAQLLLVVLTWLMAMGIPLAEAELPVRDQTIAVNEIANVGVALAVVDKIKKSG